MCRAGGPFVWVNETIEEQGIDQISDTRLNAPPLSNPGSPEKKNVNASRPERNQACSGEGFMVGGLSLGQFAGACRHTADC
jgi:hypothetical protein